MNNCTSESDGAEAGADTTHPEELKTSYFISWDQFYLYLPALPQFGFFHLKKQELLFWDFLKTKL